MVGAANGAFPEAVAPGKIGTVVRAVVPERLYLTVLAPEEDEFFAEQLQADRLLPADVAGGQRRIPVFLEPGGRDQAAPVVWIGRLDEGRCGFLVEVACSKLLPAAGPAAADLV